ncbi:MAG: tetratricopeptide repeat protein [bacterium]|nr:tetratricopeptide repeat protein [bacterium]
MGSARGPAVASLVVGALLCGGCSYNPVIRDKPEREQVLIQAAALALARGDFDQAIQGFERVLERDPDHLQALLGSARANLSAREAEVALARFAAYRAQGGPWRSAEQWDYCRALALGSEQALELQEEPLRALELAESLVAEACADALAPA